MTTREVAACRPETELAAVWSAMTVGSHASLPIVQRGRRPLGVLHARDVLRALLGEAAHEEALPRDYVMGVGHR